MRGKPVEEVRAEARGDQPVAAPAKEEAKEAAPVAEAPEAKAAPKVPAPKAAAKPAPKKETKAKK